MNKGTLAKKVGLGAIAALTAFAGLAPFATGAGAATNYTQVRYAGEDRFETAALIAAAIAEATPTAVLARADIYPDALTGAFAAAANGDGPMLLTRSDDLPDTTADALEAEGVENVIVLGGPDAIDEDVVDELEDLGYNVERIFGATRYQTAIEIAEDGAGIIGTIDGERTALLSSGENFPDALAGAPLSFAAGLPSLLTPSDLDGPAAEVGFFQDTVDALNDLNIDQVLVLGGPAAVSEDIEEFLVEEGFDVSRIHGGDRHSTSVEIFEYGLDKEIYTNRRFGLARSDTFPDALAYAPLAGRPRTSPAPASGVADTGGSANGLLLTPRCDLHSEVEEFILENQATWTQGEILGGEEAICEEVADEVEELASTGRSDVDVDNVQVSQGGTITGRITGENIASVTVSGCGFNNQVVTRDAEGDFTLQLPASQTTDCVLTFTTTFTDGSTETDQVPIDVVAPGDPNVTLNPSSGPTGSTVTASLSGDRPGEVTDVSSTNCTITNEQDSGTSRTFTIAGTQGQACTITTTVTYTDAAGGTETFTDTFTISNNQQPGGGAAATSRPELISAAIVSTRTNSQGTAANPEGTVVRYCFDEEITGIDSVDDLDQFRLYDRDGNMYQGEYSGSGATESPFIEANGTCVLVRFLQPFEGGPGGGGLGAGPGLDLNTADAVSRLTLATVTFGAVQDDEGEQSPEGDAPLGATGGTALVAGRTNGPDLMSVTTTGVQEDPDANPGTNNNQTVVTFTFDENAFVVDAAGFTLLTLDGEVVQCFARDNFEGGQPNPDEEADTTVEVLCDNTIGTGPISQAEIARGVVDTGTVSDSRQDIDPDAAMADDDCFFMATPCEGNVNPLQSSGGRNNSPDGNSDLPDLVSATLNEGATSAEAPFNAVDSITYTFDEPVFETDCTLFGAYDNEGNEYFANVLPSGNDTRPSNTTITCEFDDGALENAVGAIVLAGAVEGSTGEIDRVNYDDEEGVANASGTTQTAGRTDDPDLIGVRLVGNGDAIYTFDEDIADADTERFFLYLADGTRLVCVDGGVIEDTNLDGTGDNDATDNQFRCTQFEHTNAQEEYIYGGGGATGVDATDAQVAAAKVGTVGVRAVDSQNPTAGDSQTNNPEGAELTTTATA